MARPNKQGLVKDTIVPHRMNDAELEVLEKVADKMADLNPLMKKPCRADIISMLLKLGVQMFEARHGKIELKREKTKKTGNS